MQEIIMILKHLNDVSIPVFISSGVSIHPSLSVGQSQTLLQLFPTKFMGQVTKQSLPQVPSGHSM